MPFKFYIDNQLTDEPMNDSELLTAIRRESSLQGLLITQDGELKWNGNNLLQPGEISGYNYLKSKLDDSICSESELEVYDQISGSETYLLYKGVIKTTQISVQEQEVILTCKIQDDSYYSYIRNNSDLKVNFSANVTKSNEEFEPCQQYSIDLFNSNGCAYGSFIGALYHGYRIQDAFEFIIKAISDNKLSFRSDYLDALTEPIFLFKGQDLLNPYTLFPSAQEPVYEISFNELFREASKIYNLIFFIDSTDANNPVFRIENFEYSFGSEVMYEFTDIKELKTSVDATNLYSAVLVGSRDVVDGISPAYTWNAATSNFGWKPEQFFPLGQCNTNTELNLVNEFILDNNAIQDILVLNGDRFIDNYFFIQCSNVDTVAFTADGHQFTYFGSTDCFYNLGINNFFKMQRHSVLFETTFGNFLGVGTNGFRALLGDSGAQDILYTTMPVIVNNPIYIDDTGVALIPVPYVNETTNGGFDDGNNYNNTTNRYTAPVTGNYSFLQRIFLQIAGMDDRAANADDILRITMGIHVFDSGAVFKFAQTQVYDFSGQISNGTHTIDVSMAAILNATDIVVASYAIQYLNPNGNIIIPPKYFAILNTSFFECNGTPDGGISITSGNSDVKKYIHEFTDNINATDWRSIKTDIVRCVTFEKDGIVRTGWIQDMQHNDQTGQTTIKLLTSNATITE